MLTTDDPAPSHPLDLPVLIDAGDTACTFGDRETLVEVVRALCLGLASPIQAELLAVEQLAPTDFEAAQRHWNTVARCFRDWIAASLVHRN